MKHVQFLYFEGCPSHSSALQRLRQVLDETQIKAALEIIKVETDEQAQALKFTGSPTILINGEDIAPPPVAHTYNLTCRIYHLEDGRISPLPSPEMIRRKLQATV